jgi:hypothetical protein
MPATTGSSGKPVTATLDTGPVRAVTGIPGRVTAYFKDPRLPHQIQLLFGSGGIIVSCNCLRKRHGQRAANAVITCLEPDRREGYGKRRLVAEAVTAYLEWHDANRLEVSSRVRDMA